MTSSFAKDVANVYIARGPIRNFAPHRVMRYTWPRERQKVP